jgi:hypothetical protein
VLGGALTRRLRDLVHHGRRDRRGDGRRASRARRPGVRCLNASRQVGGAVGVALLGALVAAHGSFTPGMELAMLLAAVASAAGAVVSSTTLRRHRAE